MPPKSAKKIKLAELLIARGLVPNVERAAALVMAGKVLVDGQPAKSAASLVAQSAELRVEKSREYVGRGAYKLKGALEKFSVSAAGRVCADVGSSTGGFTEVLLEAGAERVYAIDVGYGELDWKLRSDARVVVLERTNARHLDRLPEAVSLVVIDVSFISLKLIFPQAIKWGAAGEKAPEIIALIKPQFEAPREAVEPGGVILNPDTHRAVLENILGWAATHALSCVGLCRSPIKGADGNLEFLAHLVPGKSSENNLQVLIEAVLA